MNSTGAARRRVALVTGTRAEWGLLRPVARAIAARPELELRIIAAGAHLLPPARTIRDVAREFPIAATVPMQRAGASGRGADAAAAGAGMAGFARAIGELRPDWLIVLGDRIEAFAGASAASIGGVAVAHVHGGDRAEGVADEAMRHAITKLAHLHLPATEESAQRIVRMGEPESLVVCVGSPAVDGLAEIPAMDDTDAAAIGNPRAVLLMHPCGLGDEQERAWTHAAISCVHTAARGRAVLALHPNFDPGREGVLAELRAAERAGLVRLTAHLERARFIGLLKRLWAEGGVLVGNSSAGLIEAAALGVAAVNLGPRQAGRERAGNVIDVPTLDEAGPARGADLAERVAAAAAGGGGGGGASSAHPFGDGRAGGRIAALLAGESPGRGMPGIDPHDPRVRRKRNSY